MTFPILTTGAVIQYPATKQLHFSTWVSRFLDGSEQRYRNFGSVAQKWSIRLEKLTEGELNQIAELYTAVQGTAGSFSFTDPWDGSVHASCSFEDDDLQLDFADVLSAGANFVIRSNRS